jgi:hypothetical protein
MYVCLIYRSIYQFRGCMGAGSRDIVRGREQHSDPHLGHHNPVQGSAQLFCHYHIRHQQQQDRIRYVCMYLYVVYIIPLHASTYMHAYIHASIYIVPVSYLRNTYTLIHTYNLDLSKSAVKGENLVRYFFEFGCSLKELIVMYVCMYVC